jgi:hypothetical protein
MRRGLAEELNFASFGWFYVQFFCLGFLGWFFCVLCYQSDAKLFMAPLDLSRSNDVHSKRRTI